MDKFFVGCKPWIAKRLERPCMISANTFRGHLLCGENETLIDSGAFTTIFKHGGYPPGKLVEYAKLALRLTSANKNIIGFVSQDYMCLPDALNRTGLTLEEHQRYTLYRYKALQKLLPNIYVMPVLQGSTPQDYINHVRMYGDILKNKAWVGVGSLIKLNKNPKGLTAVLQAIKNERPELLLHGFGIKTTALKSQKIQELLYSSDSYSWQYGDWKKGKRCDCHKSADKFALYLETLPIQQELPLFD